MLYADSTRVLTGSYVYCFTQSKGTDFDQMGKKKRMERLNALLEKSSHYSGKPTARASRLFWGGQALPVSGVGYSGPNPIGL